MGPDVFNKEIDRFIFYRLDSYIGAGPLSLCCFMGNGDGALPDYAPDFFAQLRAKGRSSSRRTPQHRVPGGAVGGLPERAQATGGLWRTVNAYATTADWRLKVRCRRPLFRPNADTRQNLEGELCRRLWPMTCRPWLGCRPSRLRPLLPGALTISNVQVSCGFPSLAGYSA